MRSHIVCFVLLIFTISVGGNAQAIQPGTAQTNIDHLEICQCLTQEERGLLKKYPVICDALAVVDQRPRFTQEHHGPYRCNSLKDIAMALLSIGDKEAALAGLRLAHKDLVAMPLPAATDTFFSGLMTYDYGDPRNAFSLDEIYSQEFLDDLLARCHDDFSDNIFSNGPSDGNARFCNTLVHAMNYFKPNTSNVGVQPDDHFEKGLNFITRLPENKTCEGMREWLFIRFFRNAPFETVAPLVNDIPDPETQKEFAGYLAELKEQQLRDAIPSKETSFSTLAVATIQDGQYEQGIDYIIEGAGFFSMDNFMQWSSAAYSFEDSFLFPPLWELSVAVQEVAVRETVRKKLQTLLELFKDHETTAQTQQLRAVLEMQIALGFEEDAIPVLKTMKGDESDEVPLWNAETVAKFQLRCGLINEAIKTYLRKTFRDAPPENYGHVSRPPTTTDRTEFLQNLIRIAISRNEFAHAKRIIEQIRQDDEKPPMLILLAQAYQKSGDWDTALEIVTTLESSAFRFDGYLALLYDLLDDPAQRRQNAKPIATLCDKCCGEISITDDPGKWFDQYYDLVKLLYRSDERETAMRLADHLDSPYFAAWILLNLATTHEMSHQGFYLMSSRKNFLTQSPAEQTYPDSFYNEERLISSEYHSVNHYLNLASATKSAQEILKQVAVEEEQRTTLFEPDKAAMRMLLDKAMTQIDKENEPFRLANTLGAIGEMEYIYFSQEDAHKRFNEALELLKTVKIEPRSSPVAFLLPPFFTELGEPEKALESVQIARFGHDPDAPVRKLDPYKAVLLAIGDDYRNVEQLETLAKNGDAERATQLFFEVYPNLPDYGKPQQLATLPIIALYHDRQTPDHPMLPKSQEQYCDLFGQMIREVNDKKEAYEKGAELRELLHAWANGEKRIQAVRTEIARQTEHGGDSPGLAENHIMRTQRGYTHWLFYGNPLLREPFYQ